MFYGHQGKILRVDLTTGRSEVERPDERLLRTYFGGWGLIAYYLLKEMEPGTDPLGPGNVLIFATGPMTGTPVIGSSRSAVGAKSPLTGGFGEADVGGFWGTELKNAGWDAIVIEGQATEPVYLWIKDDQVEMRDAAHLWGKKTAEVEAILREELRDAHSRVLQCGVAGENLVRYACVMGDITRAAGRTGMGAVMGSKKLRAIAVRGSGETELAERDRLLQMMTWLRYDFQKQLKDFQEHGTSVRLLSINKAEGLPTRNFQETSFEGAEKLTGEAMTKTILIGQDACFNCPVGCKRKVKVMGRYETDPTYGGPEYETLTALGACCGIDDLEAVAYGNQLCNAYGQDTISTGVTIAWAMECFERGLLTKEDTGGLELRFGNAQAMVALVEQIAHRQGFGNLLAEGAWRAAQRIGRGTQKYAMQVKGQEIPMRDPRQLFALGLGYAISPTGADHTHNIRDHHYKSERGIRRVRSLGILEPPLPIDYLGPEKVRLAKYHIDWQVFWNCLGLCMFMPYSTEQLRDVVQMTTGWNSSIFELMKVGERAMALARAFNYREGFTAQDDVAHWRFSAPESKTSQGRKVPADKMALALDLYYEMSGWDKETGAPIAGKLCELGIDWVAELLYGD